MRWCMYPPPSGNVRATRPPTLTDFFLVHFRWDWKPSCNRVWRWVSRRHNWLQFSRPPYWLKDFRHCKHLKSFSPAWVLKWCLRESNRLKDFWYSTHLKSFSPIHVWRWVSRPLHWLKDFWHCKHLKGLAPVNLQEFSCTRVRPIDVFVFSQGRKNNASRTFNFSPTSTMESFSVINFINPSGHGSHPHMEGVKEAYIWKAGKGAQLVFMCGRHKEVLHPEDKQGREPANSESSKLSFWTVFSPTCSADVWIE